MNHAVFCATVMSPCSFGLPTPFRFTISGWIAKIHLRREMVDFRSAFPILTGKTLRQPREQCDIEASGPASTVGNMSQSRTMPMPWRCGFPGPSGPAIARFPVRAFDTQHISVENPLQRMLPCFPDTWKRSVAFGNCNGVRYVRHT